MTERPGRRACLMWFGLMLLAADARGDVLEQAKAAAFEAGVQATPARRQLSLERMMTGLGLAIAGGRLVWYRFEDKDCREPVGPRCGVTVWAGAAGLASGLLLMTVFADVPAAPSVDYQPRPGGGTVRAVVSF